MHQFWHRSREPTLHEADTLLRNGTPDFICWFKQQGQNDRDMNVELRQVANGFNYKVRSFNGYDINGYRFHTTRYEQSRPNRRTTNTGVYTPGDDGVEYYGRVEEIYELTFEGSKPLHPVIFKCHWFNPDEVRRTPNLGLVEIQRSSVYAGDDVYIVAQQATQVYYIPYPCQIDENLIGWDVVYKVRPHAKLPVPIDADYSVNTKTNEVEFFQEDGLEGRFEIDLTDLFGMEVDSESGSVVYHSDDEDEIDNANDLQLLERLQIDDDSADDIPPVHNIPPSDLGQEYLNMDDNDDDFTNGPTNMDDNDDYF